jgi:hypothetical protein
MYVVKPEFGAPLSETMLQIQSDLLVDLLKRGLAAEYADSMDLTIVAEPDDDEARQRCRDARVSCDIVVLKESRHRAGNEEKIEVVMMATAVPVGGDGRPAASARPHTTNIGAPRDCKFGQITDAHWSRCRSMNARALARQVGEHHLSYHRIQDGAP